MLSPRQFGEYHAADVDYTGSAADYGAAHKGRETRNSPHTAKTKATAGAGRQWEGTSDRAVKYAGPTEAGVALRKKFVPHAGTGRTN